MKSESEMTNAERFTTADERMNAFRHWCLKQNCKSGCPIRKKLEEDNTGAFQCSLYWLELEYETKLKPCPFCGSEASINSGTEDYYVSCRNVDCAAALVARSFSSEEEAINAWNRRA